MVSAVTSSADHPVAVVTGASSGIGRATARQLAQAGWRVIGVGRHPVRSAEAEEELRAAAGPGPAPEMLRADFAEMREVLRTAQEIRARTGRIDVLINNAGGWRDARYVSSEGLEATFAANHLAAFLLTRELRPVLAATAARRPPGSVRVLAVSSEGHQVCEGMRWDDLNMAGEFAAIDAYCQAKLANLLFTRELARRAAGDGIVAQAMHPGIVATNFGSHGDPSMQEYMAANASMPPDEPARTLVWLATAPEAGRDGGRYFHDLHEVAAAPQALDDDAAARLWRESEALLARLDI
jgi:NAD(P)-dependent dehydrogenase (short-subunit alcohol dehydrogenase family)